MKYAMYRILGNDLPPRHAPDQTVKNLEFILENEPYLPDVDKIFCLNRIVDSQKVETLKRMLDKSGREYFEIPFIKHKYDDTCAKINYVCNVNGARNHCINHGLDKEYDVILPLDGGTFFTLQGWTGFESLTYDASPDEVGVYGLSCTRLQSFGQALDPHFVPQIRETYVVGNRKITGMRELYLAFTPLSDKFFNEDLRYGQVDKVYTLWQYGMGGPWDYWEPELKKQAEQDLSKHANNYMIGGFGCRLPSHSDRDGDNLVRGQARNLGLKTLIRHLDE